MIGINNKNKLPFMLGVAGMLTGVALVSSAQAADLGGNCCADLEERVAELEATSVRKGTSKVSLKLSGMVNKALLYWDNGHDSDVYVVDGTPSSTKVRLDGNAKISSDLSAGFILEWNIVNDAANRVSEKSDDSADSFTIRYADIWMKGKLGKVSLGQGDTASNGTSEIDLSDTKVAGYSELSTVGGAFAFHEKGSGGTSYGPTLGDVFDNLDGQTRRSRIRYDTPEFAGFIASASWGEDDIWDVALRYKQKFNDIQLAAAVAYSESDDEAATTTERLNGSISVLHTPTGLNLTFGIGDDDTDGSTLEKSFWYGKVGIKQKWVSLGETALSFDYAQADEMAEATGDYKHYGIQLVQNIDAAAMEIYAAWSHNEYETNTEKYDDIDLFMVGSRIKF